MQYNQPFDQPTNANAPYVNGNPAAGVPGSIPPAAAIEYPQREILNVIAADPNLVPANTDLTQLLQAILYLIGKYSGGGGGGGGGSFAIPYGVDSGLANIVDVTFTPALESLAAGQLVEVKIANSNTGASTITANALSTVPIVDRFGNGLTEGDLQANETLLMMTTGSAFQIIGKAARWQKWADVTVGAGGVANVDFTLPSWANLHRITVIPAPDPSTDHNVWMRVSLDGSTFLAGASSYYADSVGTGSNGYTSESAMPVSCTNDNSSGVAGAYNLTTFFPGASGICAGANTDYWGRNAAYGRILDYGKIVSFCQVAGAVEKIRFIAGGYFFNGPSGLNILQGTRIIIEGMN